MTPRPRTKMSLPREASHESVAAALQLIEHHITVLEHSPHMADATAAAIRGIVDDVRASLRASAAGRLTCTPYARTSFGTSVGTPSLVSARAAVSKPFTRATVYTFGSHRPFSVVRSSGGPGAVRRRLYADA